MIPSAKTCSWPNVSWRWKPRPGAWIAFAIVCLCAGAGLAEETKREPLGPRYGKTPETAVPYRDFKEPYLAFFTEPIEFLGTGRDRKTETGPSLRVGFLGPTEPAVDADLGAYMLEGVLLAMEEANAAGGCNGLPIELVVREDKGLWGATSNQMVAFKYEDDVLAVLGSIDGANTHIALRVALKIQVPMVNTGTTDPTLTETNIPWLLRCMADDRQQGYALAHHAYAELGLERVVAFRVNDRYGRTGIGEFTDAARRQGHPLLGELRWDPGERTFDRQLDRIEALAPEAIVLWGNAADAAAVARAIRDRGMTQQIMGSDRLASRAFIELAGDAADGVVAAASYDPTRGGEEYDRFVEAYEDRFGRRPETFAAHAYDGMTILIDAMRKAGPNRALIRDALYECRTLEGVTGIMEFDATLNDVGPVYLARIEGGHLAYREVDFSVGSADSPPYHELEDTDVAAGVTDRSPAGGRLRVGAFLPLDESGQQIAAGMQLALQQNREAHPEGPNVELVVRDARGQWNAGTARLVDLVTRQDAIAVLGSTDREGSHLIGTLAAKLHLPVLPLCSGAPSLTQIPLPWVFCAAPELSSESDLHRLGYDAMAVVLARIQEGARTRKSLRDALATGDWYHGKTGVFRFDRFGNRLDREDHSFPSPSRRVIEGTSP